MFVVACSSVPSPAKPASRRYALACDGEWSSEAVASKQRAWLAPRQRGHVPVTVVDSAGDDVLVASVTPDVIVARWVPHAALGRAVIRDTHAWRSPGERDRDVRLLPGLPLPAADEKWLRIPAGDDVELAGYVSVDDRGSIWTKPEPAPRVRRLRFHVPMIVRAEPDAAAPIRATVPAGTPIEIVLHYDKWLEIVVHTERAVIAGYVERPPPPPPPPPRRPRSPDEPEPSEIDMGDSGPPPTVAAHTCLVDAPGGNVVGVVWRDFVGTIEPATPSGWYRLRVKTAWGEAAYYTNTPPLPAPPVEEIDDENFQWKFDRGPWSEPLPKQWRRD